MTYIETICKYVNSIEITPDRIDTISEEAYSDSIEIELMPIKVSRRDISYLMANERKSYAGWQEQYPPSRHFVDYSRIPSNRMDSNRLRLCGLSAGFVVDEMETKGSYTPPTAKYRQFIDRIKKVIFQDGTTVILWKNGDKTVVKAQEGESVDYEKGFAMAIAKYFFGNEGNYYEAFKKFVPEEDKKGHVTEKCKEEK